MTWHPPVEHPGPLFETLIRPWLPQGWEITSITANGEFLFVSLIGEDKVRGYIFASNGGLWSYNERLQG